MKKLADALNKTTRGIVKSRGFGDTRLLTEWESVVGSELARNSIPVKIKYPSHETGDIVLVVRVNSGWTTEFSYMEPIILEKIATFFGSRVVSKLQILSSKITVYPKTNHNQEQELEPDGTENQNTFANLTETVNDSGLKAALESLGKQIRKKK